MKSLFLIFAILFSMSAFAVDRQYDRQIPADRNLQLNKLTIGVANSTPTTDIATVYGSMINAPSVQTGITFNFYKSSVVQCTSCGALTGSQTITLTGISDGGYYTIDSQDTTSTVTNTYAASGLTFLYLPSGPVARTTGKQTSVTFHRVGLKVLVTTMEF